MECRSQRSTEAGSYRTLTIYALIVLFLIDRGTKFFALHYFTSEYMVNSYLYFQLMFNRGISWGMFNTHHTITFISVSCAVILVTSLMGWYAYNRLKQGYTIVGELLILTGSLSNIIDRFWYGGVIDFIGLQYGSWYFPVFNIADAAVVCGIGILLVQQVVYAQ
jgi:signal peptidase II